MRGRACYVAHCQVTERGARGRWGGGGREKERERESRGGGESSARGRGLNESRCPIRPEDLACFRLGDNFDHGEIRALVSVCSPTYAVGRIDYICNMLYRYIITQLT
jgi:hypothetical protein